MNECMHTLLAQQARPASTRQGKWRQQSLQQRLRGSRYNRVTKGRPTIPKSLIGVGCERCEAEKSWIHPSDIAHRSKPLELEEARSAKSKMTTSVIEGGFFVHWDEWRRRKSQFLGWWLWQWVYGEDAVRWRQWRWWRWDGNFNWTVKKMCSLVALFSPRAVVDGDY